jgi:hypothetical protein
MRVINRGDQDVVEAAGFLFDETRELPVGWTTAQRPEGAHQRKECGETDNRNSENERNAFARDDQNGAKAGQKNCRGRGGGHHPGAQHGPLRPSTPDFSQNGLQLKQSFAHDPSLPALDAYPTPN